MARQWRSFFTAMESLKMKIQNLVRRIFNWKRYRTVSIMLLVVTFLLTSGVLPVRSQSLLARQQIQAVDIGIQRIQEGKDAYKQDRFEDAFKIWTKAEEAYQQIKNQDGVSKSRFYQFQALKSLGMNSQACSILISAIPAFTAPATCNELDDEINKQSSKTYWKDLVEKVPLDNVSMWHSLGESLRLIGDLEKAKESLEKIKDSGKPEVLLSLGNTEKALGNLERDRRLSAIPVDDYLPWRYPTHKKVSEAILHYQQAEAHYKSVISFPLVLPTLKNKAQINYFSILVEQGKTKEAQEEWLSISLNKKEFSSTYLLTNISDIYAQIGLAKNLAYLKQLSEKNLYWEKSPSWSDIFLMLNNALEKAKALNSRRAQSYALGNLGGVYEYCMSADDKCQQPSNQDLSQLARNYTEQALILAQPNEAPDLAYQWQWQIGRLSKLSDNESKVISNDESKVISNYEAAIHTLEYVRGDLLTVNSDIQFSFRDNIEPLYRKLVSLLLKSSATADLKQSYLKRAIEVVDTLQVAELENFLRCNISQSVQVSQVADQNNEKTAILYPIVLEDGVEVILKLPNKPEIISYFTPIERGNLEGLLVSMRKSITDKESGSDEYELLSKKVYDYILKKSEEYISLDIQTLVFVLDESLRNIPMASLWNGENFLIEKYAVAITPGLNLLGPKRIKTSNFKALIVGLTEKGSVKIGEKTFPFSALNNVGGEVASIKKVLPDSRQLINADFTLGKLRDIFKSSSFPVVHLATHGNFSSTPQETFILSGVDSYINVKSLQGLLKSGVQGKSNNLELLVFSACKTAQGDRRATLGMAGAAIKAGANSTMATLWSVDDKSTPLLIENFYKELKEGLGKDESVRAKALQKSQLSLLDSKDYSHPYFWSSFVLVGSWL
jgi:CHAT domain-containing protein